jgi:hypothetical protein
VRIADAVRTPHDSLCLASWLCSQVTSATRVLLDSATLSPVAVSLQLMAARSGEPLPTVAVVDDYHQTSFDIRQMMTGAANVLVIQSVSSTGSLTERLSTALDRSDLPGTIHVLVDRQRDVARNVAGAGAENAVERWIGLAALDEVYPNAGVCRFCVDPERSRVVQIDPISFAGTLLPQPRLVSPSIRAARHNRGLWELANERQAIGPLASPSESTRERRPKPIALKMYVGELFVGIQEAPALEAALRARIASNWKRMTNRELHLTDLVVAWSPDPDEWSPRDALATDVAWATGSKQNTKALLDLVFTTLAELTPDQDIRRQCPDIVWVDRDNPELSQEDVDRIGGASEILVFDWSTVTGTLLRDLISRIRSINRPWRHETTIRGLVVHARPESTRAFEDLQEAFDRDLVALWLTFMPMTGRSPFDRELRLLGLLKAAIASGDVGALDAEAKDDIAQFVELRLEFLHSKQQDWRRRRDDFSASAGAAEVMSPYAVFWGLPLRLQLTETVPIAAARRLHGRSLFGAGLDSISLLAAAGNAVQTVRNEGASGPEWQQFDMPLAIDAFHESIVVVAFLRWLGPAEIWWGETPQATQRTIATLIHRAEPGEETAVVVAELLLAVAEGKIPPRFAHIPIEHARSMVQDAELGPFPRMALQTGLVLAMSDLPVDARERSGLVERLHDLRGLLIRSNFDLKDAATILQRNEGPVRS